MEVVIWMLCTIVGLQVGAMVWMWFGLSRAWDDLLKMDAVLTLVQHTIDTLQKNIRSDYERIVAVERVVVEAGIAVSVAGNDTLPPRLVNSGRVLLSVPDQKNQVPTDAVAKTRRRK